MSPAVVLCASFLASHTCTEECEWSVVNGEFEILTTDNSLLTNALNVQVSDTTKAT